jgi:hypothetical protein
LVVDFDSLDPVFECREVALEELAAGAFACGGCGGGEDDIGVAAGLELRGDGASEKVSG